METRVRKFRQCTIIPVNKVDYTQIGVMARYTRIRARTPEDLNNSSTILRVVVEPVSFDYVCKAAIDQLTQSVLSTKQKPPTRLLACNVSKSNEESQKRRHSSAPKRAKDFQIMSVSERYQLLNELRLKAIFLDMVITCVGSEYGAHRAVMSRVSPVVQRILSDHIADTVLVAEMNQSTHLGIIAIIDYAYNHSLVLSVRNLIDVYRCARELEIDQLIQYCDSFIAKLAVGDAVLALICAKQCDSPLARSIYEMICCDLGQHISSKSFCRLSAPSVIKLLQMSEYDRDEGLVLLGALRYIHLTGIHENIVECVRMLDKIRWRNLSSSSVDVHLIVDAILAVTTEHEDVKIYCFQCLSHIGICYHTPSRLEELVMAERNWN